jgi:hypothetical protein
MMTLEKISIKYSNNNIVNSNLVNIENLSKILNSILEIASKCCNVILPQTIFHIKYKGIILDVNIYCCNCDQNLHFVFNKYYEMKQKYKMITEQDYIIIKEFVNNIFNQIFVNYYRENTSIVCHIFHKLLNNSKIIY